MTGTVTGSTPVSLNKKGVSGEFFVASAATSAEEIGNGVYPPVKRILEKRGIDCGGKYAVQLKKSDYASYDYIVCMDKNNLRNTLRIIGEDTDNKISLLLDYTSHPSDVADPWYTRDFESALNDIDEGCTALLKHISEKYNI